MKKEAAWLAALSAIALVTARAAPGMGVYEMDENILAATA